jgi:hypothetical protein
MLVARCYAVLDSLVVEVSCVHLGDQEASHIVIREERRPTAGEVRDGLRALADVCDLAVFHFDAERARLGDGGTEDCRP